MKESKIPAFVKQGDGYVDIELVKAISVAGAKVSTVRMREPTVGDQLAVDKIEGKAALEITFLANLCELAPDDIQKLTLRDYARLQAGYALFID